MNEGHDPKQQRTVPYVVRIVEDQWTTWRHVIEAIAIVAAGLWAFYTFVYQENIKPASEPAALTPKIIVSRLGRDATRDLLNVTLQFRNSGKTEIDIAADAIDVYGVRYGTKPVAKTQSLGKKFVSFSRQLPVISRTVVLRQYELRALAKGGMAGYHIVLEPGATADLPMDLALPRGAYDAVEVQAYAVPLKTSVTKPVTVGVTTEKDGGYALVPNGSEGAYEDNVGTSFALIP